MVTGVTHRIAVVEAAKTMAREATEAARDAEANSAEWRFYHGVETAAAHVLRPEMALVRDGTEWLDSEDPAFREGFLEASLILGTASTSADPPLRLRLPQPPAPSPRK